MISLFEKLINEHGSSAILKERLTILKDEYAAMEKTNNNLTMENLQLKTELDTLKKELSRFKSIHTDFACDHCGSTNLKREGAKPHPIFGDSGVKIKIFKCLDCAKITEIDKD